MGLKDNIKRERQRNNLTLEEVANSIGITRQTVQKYESGLVSNIPSDKIELMAKLFKVSPAYLMGWEDEPKQENKVVPLHTRENGLLSKYRTLNAEGKDMVDGYTTMIAETPKYTETPLDKVQTSIIYYDIPVSAGTGQYLDNSGYIMLDVMETPPTGSEFVVRVCGDSMQPTYKDGDKLYISPTEKVAEGEIGIFSVNGDVFVKECGAGQLISHNTNYKPIQISECDNVQCFGKVVGMCKKYR